MAYSIWIPVQTRSSGTHTSGSVTIPNGINVISVRLLTTLAEFNDPSETLTLDVEVFRSGVWQNQMTVRWVGGSQSKSGEWNAAISGIAPLVGLSARARITQTGTFSWGLEGEIT